MADPLSDAQSQISASKVANLAAIAAAGQQGQQQYQAALASNASSRQSAISGLMSSLAGMGAPANFAASEQARLAQPFDLAGANLAQMGQARQDFLANLGQTAGTYYDQTNAAVPAMRAAAQNALLVAQQKAADAQLAHDQAIQLGQLHLQAAQAAAAKAAAPQTTGQWITAQGGQTQAGNVLVDTGAQQNAADQAAQVAAMANVTPNPMGFGAAGISQAYPTVAPASSLVQPGVTNPNTTTAGGRVLNPNELLAELGAGGAAGIPGSGIPQISPAVAGQLYAQTDQGVAEAKAAAAATLQASDAEAYTALTAALGQGANYERTVGLLYARYPAAVADRAIARYQQEQSAGRATAAAGRSQANFNANNPTTPGAAPPTTQRPLAPGP